MRTSYSFLLVLTLGLLSCESIFVAEPERDPEALYDYFWSTFDREYAPFAERGVDWQEVYATYRPLVGPGTSEDSLFALMSQSIAELNDGHVSLTAPGRPVFHANAVRRNRPNDAAFNRQVIKSYLDPDFREGPDTSFISGTVAGTGIAYIHFDHVGENLLELPEFLLRHASGSGFVIDLRHNKGGDFTYFFTELGHLVDEARPVFRSRTRNGPHPGDFTEWTTWGIEPASAFVDLPVVVLTDRYTISAGERAVMALRTLPNITVVGDTTNGAHGTLVGRELPNGWFTSLTPQQVEPVGSASLEGQGIPPDLVVTSTPDAVAAGSDRVLEAALGRFD